MAKELLYNDPKWLKFFTRAAFFKRCQGSQSVFVKPLIHEKREDPVAVENTFKELIYDELQHEPQNQVILERIYNSQLNFRLYLIGQRLNSNIKPLTTFGLPEK